MRISISNIMLWVILTVALALFLPTAFLLPRQYLFEVMDSVCIAVGAGVVVGYSKSTWDAVRLPPHQMTAAHLIITGAWLVSLAAVVVFSGQWAWRVSGKQDWIIDSLPIAFSRWIFGSGLILSLLTGYSREGVIVVSAYKRTAVLVALAVFIAALLIGIGLG